MATPVDGDAMATPADPDPVAPRIDSDATTTQTEFGNNIATQSNPDDTATQAQADTDKWSQMDLDAKLYGIKIVFMLMQGQEQDQYMPKLDAITYSIIKELGCERQDMTNWKEKGLEPKLQYIINSKGEALKSKLPQSLLDDWDVITKKTKRCSSIYDEFFEGFEFWAKELRESNSDDSRSLKELCDSCMKWIFERWAKDPSSLANVILSRRESEDEPIDIKSSVPTLLGSYAKFVASLAHRDGEPSESQCSTETTTLGTMTKPDTDVIVSTDQEPQPCYADNSLKAGNREAPSSGNEGDAQPLQQEKDTGVGKGPEYALEGLHISS